MRSISPYPTYVDRTPDSGVGSFEDCNYLSSAHKSRSIDLSSIAPTDSVGVNDSISQVDAYTHLIDGYQRNLADKRNSFHTEEMEVIIVAFSFCFVLRKISQIYEIIHFSYLLDTARKVFQTVELETIGRWNGRCKNYP